MFKKRSRPQSVREKVAADGEEEGLASSPGTPGTPAEGEVDAEVG